MGVWLGPRGPVSGITETDFHFTGNYLFKQDAATGKWEAALLGSGTLSFSKNPGKVDIFLVGGGQKAPRYEDVKTADEADRNSYSGPSFGDPGGNGGETVTASGISTLKRNVNYSVTIGASDKNTSFSGSGISLTALAGAGKKGGKGAYVPGSSSTAAGVIADRGADGVYAYGKTSDTLLFTEEEFPGHQFGPGGGGGATLRYKNLRWANGAEGGESNGPDGESGHGGTIYGSSSSNIYPDGKAGFANHGQGGGGAAYYYNGAFQIGAQGLGGSGVVFIRSA